MTSAASLLSRPRRLSPRRHPFRARPHLEALEQRTVLSSSPASLAPAPGVEVQPLLTVAGDDPADYVVDTAVSPELDGVVRLTLVRADGTFTCSGSLISNRHVLTAAHCLTRVGLFASQMTTISATVSFPLATGTVTRLATTFYVYPGWGGSVAFLNGGDVAVVELAPLTTAPAAADQYELWRTDLDGSEIGKTGIKAGYGLTGTGVTGAVSGSAGTLHAGQNEIDRFGFADNQLWFDFDSGSATHNVFGSLGLGDDEVFTSSGDSGGPLFLVDSETNTIKVAGVTSYLLTTRKDTNRSAISSFGEVGGDTRVSSFAEWIDAVVAGEVDPTPFGQFFYSGRLAGRFLAESADAAPAGDAVPVVAASFVVPVSSPAVLAGTATTTAPAAPAAVVVLATPSAAAPAALPASAVTLSGSASAAAAEEPGPFDPLAPAQAVPATDEGGTGTDRPAADRLRPDRLASPEVPPAEHAVPPSWPEAVDRYFVEGEAAAATWLPGEPLPPAAAGLPALPGAAGAAVLPLALGLYGGIHGRPESRHGEQQRPGRRPSPPAR